MGLWQAENGETLGRGGTWQEKEAVASHTTSRSPIRIARPTAAAAGHECAYLVYVLRGSRPRLN